jgi:hypothetical protein
MSAAVPLNIVQSFHNAGITLVFDPEDRKLYCHISPKEARCLFEVPNPGPTEHEDDDPNVEEFVQRVLDRAK